MTPSEIHELRKDVSGVAPDHLTRLDLLRQRSQYIRALSLWEDSIVETIDVAETPIRDLARITVRGMFAAALPLLLFAVVGGVAAAVAVQCFRMVIHFTTF